MRGVLFLLSALLLIYGFVAPDLGRGERFSFRRTTTANKVVLVTLLQWSLIPTVYGILALLRLLFAGNRVTR